jgi:hypothetical protein
VLLIEPRTSHSGNEELGGIGAGSSIGHGEHERLVMVEGLMYLIFKVFSPDGDPSSAVSLRITSLDHEVLDDSVEYHIIVIPVLRVGHKVLNSLRTLIGIEGHMDLSHVGVNDGLVAQFQGSCIVLCKCLLLCS